MTYLTSIKQQLIDSGYTIIKQDDVWKLLDSDVELMNNRSLGDMLNMAAKELGI